MKWKMAAQYRHQSGKDDHNIVFMPAPSETFSLSRKYTYPTLTANNHSMGTKMKNLSGIYKTADALWLADLRAYAQAYYSENKIGTGDLSIPPRTAFAHLIRMFWAWYDSDPTHVDLETVTVADAVALDANVRTIARAVTAGFLPVVTSIDYTLLTNDIQ